MGDERRQEFLDLLSGRSPRVPPAQGDPEPATGDSTPDPAPSGGAPAAPPAGAPLSFEQTPPAPEEVPPALAALSPEEPAAAAEATWDWQQDGPPLGSADLMDLGVDAQAQGRVMQLRTVAGRLAALIRDLATLEREDWAEPLLPVMESVVEEANTLHEALEQRGQQRRGDTGAATAPETPPAAASDAPPAPGEGQAG